MFHHISAQRFLIGVIELELRLALLAKVQHIRVRIQDEILITDAIKWQWELPR